MISIIKFGTATTIAIFILASCVGPQQDVYVAGGEATIECEIVARANLSLRRCDLPNGDVCYTYGSEFQCKFSE